MPLGFNGSGTISGLITGGLPDGVITPSEIAGNGGGFSTMLVFSTVGTTNWTVPANVTKARVTVIGGGGAGGGTNPTSIIGYGGGAGGVGIKYVTLTPGASIAVTVGTGGVAVSNGAGGAGGTSSFGTDVTATGGSGGSRTTNSFISSTTNGTATGGDINVQGDIKVNVVFSYDSVTPAMLWSSCPGADTPLGFGFGGRFRGYNANLAGVAATGYGAGGGGSASLGANLAGGNGSQGLVIVEY